MCASLSQRAYSTAPSLSEFPITTGEAYCPMPLEIRKSLLNSSETQSVAAIPIYTATSSFWSGVGLGGNHFVRLGVLDNSIGVDNTTQLYFRYFGHTRHHDTDRSSTGPSRRGSISCNCRRNQAAREPDWYRARSPQSQNQ